MSMLDYVKDIIETFPDKYKDKVFDGNKLATQIRNSLNYRIVARRTIYKLDTLSRPVLGHIIVGDLL